MTNCTDCRYKDKMCKWPCDDCVKGDKWEEMPFTNEDRLNAMAVEEKAAWIAQIVCCDRCPVDCTWTKSCAHAWFIWLKQEVKEC